jgi:hypothetical protein
MGLNAIPIVYEIGKWGSMASPDPKASEAWFKSLDYDRDTVLRLWREAVEAGSSFFLGPNSVVAKLGL